MCSVLVTFILISVPSCVQAAVTLRQPESIQLNPSETLRLTCSVSGYSLSATGNAVSWIRQSPWKGLEWLCLVYWDDDKRYLDSLKNRLTISIDSSRSQVSLEMRAMGSGDTGTYYCVTRGYHTFDYWGQGTLVTVFFANQLGPSLFPLISPSESIPSNGLMTIGCLAKNVPPALVSFSWDDYNNVSINTKYVTQYATIGNPAGTFSSISQLTVSANDWRNFQPFYCKAEHVEGVARVVRHTSCIQPEMIIRAPRLADFENSDTNATLVCKAVHLHTTNTAVQWLKNGHALDSGVATTGPVAVGPSGYSIISELTVDRRDWVSDKMFSCEVHNENFTSIKNISKSLVCDLGPCSDVQVHVETIPPSFTDIFMTKSAKLTCRISNMPYDQDRKELNVIWTREHDNTEIETKIGQAVAQENNELIFVDATATVCPEEWDSGEAFKCKVIFPSLLPTAEARSLKKYKGGTPHAPAVYVLPPPSEQLALQETATITCLLKGFYPNDFFVKWMRNNEPVGPSEYFTSQPIQESKTPERYFTYSTLNVKEQDWSYGDAYTCVVGHEALPLQTTQKTVDKNTAYLDGIVDPEDDEGLLNISSNLFTFIVLFLVSLLYSATMTVIKVK